MPCRGGIGQEDPGGEQKPGSAESRLPETLRLLIAQQDPRDEQKPGSAESRSSETLRLLIAQQDPRDEQKPGSAESRSSETLRLLIALLTSAFPIPGGANGTWKRIIRPIAHAGWRRAQLCGAQTGLKSGGADHSQKAWRGDRWCRPGVAAVPAQRAVCGWA